MAWTPHTLVSISGKLAEKSGTDEIWQIGVRGLNLVSGGNTPVDPGQLDEFLAAISALTGGIPDWYDDGTVGIPATVLLTQIKVVNIGADGKYTTAPQVVTLNNAGGQAGGAGNPSFVSLAYSWNTARNFGKRLRHGRVYPPNFGYATLSPTATVGQTAVDSAVASAKKLLSGCAKSGSQFSFTPCVMSALGGFEPITGVRVGNVWDVQRRRKNAVGETYTAAVWP